jgi:hypothetical protein
MRSERVGRAHGLFPILAKRTPRSCNPLDVTDLVIDRAIVADLMNGQPPPMQNGFPVRLVVPDGSACTGPSTCPGSVL